MSQAIGKKAKIGVAWSTLTAGIAQVVTFSLGVVLARLLLPEDFGVFAAIIIFTEVASSIVSSGFVMALVQRKDILDKHYSTALTTQIALAIAVFVGLMAISPWVGLFFRNILVGEVLAVMSIYMLILPFISIPTAMLRKRIDFRSTGITEVLQQLSGGMISVTLAYLGWGVWSLVYGRLAGHMLKAFHLAYLCRWRPRFHFSRQAGRDLFAFSGKVTMANILNDVASNIDYFLVGRLLGPAQLGFYYRAYYIMTLPLTRITDGINTVLFSAFSEVQEDGSTLKKGLLKAICYISLITFPLLIGLFWVSPAFIQTVYGEKWMGSVLPLRIMCFAGMLLSIEPIAVSGIIARGYIGFEVKRQLIYLFILLIGVSVGSYWGIVGVSFAVLLASIIFLIMLQQLLKRLIQISWYEFAEVLRPAITACAVMSLVLFSYQSIAQGFFTLYSLPMLLTSVSLGSICYIAWFLFMRYNGDNQILREVFKELESYCYKAYTRFHQIVQAAIFNRG